MEVGFDRIGNRHHVILIERPLQPHRHYDRQAAILIGRAAGELRRRLAAPDLEQDVIFVEDIEDVAEVVCVEDRRDLIPLLLDRDGITRGSRGKITLADWAGLCAGDENGYTAPDSAAS